MRIPLKRQGFLTRDARIVERKKAGLHKARKAPQFSKQVAFAPAVPRRYFGTDGVARRRRRRADARARRAGRQGGDALGGRRAGARRTRHARLGAGARGRALARGIASAGATAVLGGVLPTPAVALLAEDLGAVVSASHNPPEYNGVKLFDREGGKLVDEEEEADRGAPRRARRRAAAESRPSETRGARTSRTSSSGSAPTSPGLRIGVDCANGAFSDARAAAFERLGAEVHAIGVEPDGSNINVGCGATDLAALQRARRRARPRPRGRLRRRRRPHARRRRARRAARRRPDPRDPRARARRRRRRGHRDDEPRLPPADGRATRIRVVTTPVGDRYVLEALRREGGLLGGEQSGHLVWLGDHVTGDGLAAALLLCRALARTHAERGGGGACRATRRRGATFASRRVSSRSRCSTRSTASNAELGERRPRARAAVRHRAGRSRPGRGGKCERCRENVC